MLKRLLSNKEVNALSSHHALFMAADSILGFFGGVFFLRMGMPAWAVIMLWGSWLVIRVPFRFLIIPFWHRMTPKNWLKIGVCIIALSFMTLIRVQEDHRMIPLFFILLSMGEAIYWTSYHYLFSFCSQHEFQGTQLSLKNIAVITTTAIMPGIIGWLGETVSLGWSFFGSTLLMLLSFFPLRFIRMERGTKPIGWRGLNSHAWFGAKSFLTRSTYNYATGFVWGLIIYLFIGDISDFGMVLSIGLLMQGMLYLITGNLFDRGHGRRMLETGAGITVLQTVTQAGFIYTPLGAVLTNAVGGVRDPLLFQTGDALYYQEARRSNDRFWYHFLGEMGWDLGAGLALFLGGLLVFLGLGLRWLMILGIAGLLLHTWVNEQNMQDTQ
ncbi:MAG: MFS transporter [DPANN group archaeon]|nr:MFS transporter [DPANN group archaeon]